MTKEETEVYLVMRDGSEVCMGDNGLWETIVDINQIKEVHTDGKVFDMDNIIEDSDNLSR